MIDFDRLGGRTGRFTQQVPLFEVNEVVKVASPESPFYGWEMRIVFAFGIGAVNKVIGPSLYYKCSAITGLPGLLLTFPQSSLLGEKRP